MQKSAKYLSEKFGVNHLLPPPSMSHNGVAHNHPPLDSLMSLVMPGTDASLGANPSIHFPPIQTKSGVTKKHHKESEGEESSVISSFSTNIPHYVSRSEILKVYDVLPAHKSQNEKEKHKTSHQNDLNQNKPEEIQDSRKLHAAKERHHSKQHGSWSSRASSIMHNPESVYI